MTLSRVDATKKQHVPLLWRLDKSPSSLPKPVYNTQTDTYPKSKKQWQQRQMSHKDCSNFLKYIKKWSHLGYERSPCAGNIHLNRFPLLICWLAVAPRPTVQSSSPSSFVPSHTLCNIAEVMYYRQPICRQWLLATGVITAADTCGC